MVSRAAWLYIVLVVAITSLLVAMVSSDQSTTTPNPLAALIVLQILFLATTSRLPGRRFLFEAGELDYR